MSHSIPSLPTSRVAEIRRGAAISVAVAALLAAWPVPGAAQIGGVDLDTIRADEFDYGKMWTFENPPEAYFTETYGFEATPDWFERARLSVLRVPGCSASFVSAAGLVATNHHCVRRRVSDVSGPGESLLDHGFVARGLDEERRIPGYYADQLIAVEDISQEVFAAADGAAPGEARERARGEALRRIESRLRAAHSASGDPVRVEIVPLYDGGRYSAYVFRRFTDVRLVVAAELQTGFFGGDPDNFTYPRYALDFAFLRIYDGDGAPYRPTHYFGWGDGVEEGDVVFIIGNPGQTNRLKTVAQLEFQRDVQVPAAVAFLEGRLRAMEDYRDEMPEEAEAYDIRNLMFGVSNSLKRSSGQLAALNDPVIMARKGDAERRLREALRSDAGFREAYDGIFDRLAEIQSEKARWAAEYAAFQSLGSRFAGSTTLTRAFAAEALLAAARAGAPPDTLAMLQEELARIGTRPTAFERRLIALRFEEFRRYLGAEHVATRAALQGQTPAEAAEALLGSSILEDQAAALQAIRDGTLDAGDPAIRLVSSLLPALREYREAWNRLGNEEATLAAAIGRARFDVHGREVPPDGSSSPRITDGVVMGYEYNGTLAPPYTTFYGMYDRYVSHGRGSARGLEWELPQRWLEPPAGLDLATPLNFVSTADTYGGNSGSPAVTPGLDLVGLNFDRNVEGLSRDFIYLPERGRNIMVDVRAVLASLDHAYDADRIVAEVKTGQLYPTEEEADAALAADGR